MNWLYQTNSKYNSDVETVAAAIWISTFWKGIGKEIVWKMKGRMNKCNQNAHHGMKNSPNYHPYRMQ